LTIEDLGPRSSYVALAEGTPVFCSDGSELGRVAHVLADISEDVFDGIVVHEAKRQYRFADADQVGDIYEQGVFLKIDSVAASELPRPSENPAVMHDDPALGPGTPLGQKLRRAWDLISGRR